MEHISVFQWVNMGLNLVVLPLWAAVQDIRSRVTRLEALREAELEQRRKAP